MAGEGDLSGDGKTRSCLDLPGDGKTTSNFNLNSQTKSSVGILMIFCHQLGQN